MRMESGGLGNGTKYQRREGRGARVSLAVGKTRIVIGLNAKPSPEVVLRSLSLRHESITEAEDIHRYL